MNQGGWSLCEQDQQMAMSRSLIKRDLCQPVLGKQWLLPVFQMCWIDFAGFLSRFLEQDQSVDHVQVENQDQESQLACGKPGWFYSGHKTSISKPILSSSKQGQVQIIQGCIAVTTPGCLLTLHQCHLHTMLFK